MKKIISLFLFLLALISSFVKPIEVKGEVEYETKSYKMLNIADSFVNGGTNADLNFGIASQLKVRYRSDYGTNYFEFYFKFQLPANAKNITKADLLLTYQSVPANIQSRSLTVSTVGSNWSEGEGKVAGAAVAAGSDAITYNTRPSELPENNNKVITFDNVPVQYDILKVDVKDLVNTYLAQYAVKDTATEISFRVHSNATANETDFNFCSKDHTKRAGPMLDLTLDVEKVIVEPTILYDGLSLTSERILNSNFKESSIHTLELDASSNLTVVTGVPENKMPLQPGLRQTPSGMATSYQNDGYNVLAAINGDFFKMNDEGTENLIQPRGLTIKDGQILTPLVEWTFFGIKKDGTPVIGDPTTFDSLKDELQHAVGGDSGYLVKNGVATSSNDAAGCHSQNSVAPRTAIGIKADNSIVMVVVDGRTTESAGLVLTDLAQHMLAKGCVNAINLDGGGSSSMAIKGSNNTFAPINKPSDAAGERPVGNGLLIIDPTTSVKLADLNSKITEATNLINNSQYGYEIGKYPEEQKNILNVAIVNAKAAKVDENKNQASIDQAVIELQKAINDFKASLIKKITDDLEVVVNEASNLLANSTYGEDIGNYPLEQKNLLTEAINAANTVISDDDTTQDDVDKAIISLQETIINFKKSIIVLHAEELIALVETAEEKLHNSSFGNEVDNYPHEAGNKLSRAIYDARQLIDGENTKQKEVDDYVIVLQNAINEFENSKILVNTGELEELINKVEYKLEDIVFGEEIGNYSPEQEQIINQALQEAKEVINVPTSTKEEIDAAISNLKNKLNDLNKAMVTTPKEPNEPSNPSEPNDPIEPITPEEPNSNNEVLFLFIGLGAGIVLSIIIFYVLKIVKKK